MKSYDFIEEGKIEDLKQFCKNHNPPIDFVVELVQKKNNEIRVIAETSVKDMFEYDNYFHLLKFGTERIQKEEPKEIPKKWYEFWKKFKVG